MPGKIMYSPRDGHDVFGQPGLIVLKWDFHFFFMVIIILHFFGIRFELFFFQKFVWLGDINGWRFGYQIERFLDFGDREIYLMGLKSLDSTVGTKPSTEAQLDSAVFKMEWFSRSCDPTNLSMGFVFLCEGSSFS
jgi:hypothetical protein